MVFLDANVFLYAVGDRDHELHLPCYRLLRQVSERHVVATSTVEVLQEVLWVISRRNRRDEAVRVGRWMLDLLPDLLVVGTADLGFALELFEAHTSLSPRDAIHAATALRAGVLSFVSADAGFDVVPGLTRVDPRSA